MLDPPRQTGKTSALLALRDLLNSGEASDSRCLYAKVENGQAMRENVAEAMRTVLAELAYQASVTLGDETLDELWPALLERVGPAQALARWCMADPRPLVLGRAAAHCQPDLCGGGAAPSEPRGADRAAAAVWDPVYVAITRLDIGHVAIADRGQVDCL